MKKRTHIAKPPPCGILQECPFKSTKIDTIVQSRGYDNSKEYYYLGFIFSHEKTIIQINISR